MSNKKFSELDSVDRLTESDLFAVSSAEGENGKLETKKVSFSQIKDRLNYDFEVAEVLEATPPPESDDTVYIVINGYRVAATRAKELVHARFPTKVKRIVPAVSGFYAVKGKTYVIPFTALNMTLSTLSVTANTSYMSLLAVDKIDNTSGALYLASNASNHGEFASIVTVADEQSGIKSTILVNHARVVSSISNQAATVEGNVIRTVWRRSEGYSRYDPNFGVIEPKFTLSQEVKHRIVYHSDYFNQAPMHKIYDKFIDVSADIILEEPFSGELVVQLEDLSQGASSLAYVNVDYQG